jgi:hypothetical protein
MILAACMSCILIDWLACMALHARRMGFLMGDIAITSFGNISAVATRLGSRILNYSATLIRIYLMITYCQQQVYIKFALKPIFINIIL